MEAEEASQGNTTGNGSARIPLTDKIGSAQILGLRRFLTIRFHSDLFTALSLLALYGF